MGYLAHWTHAGLQERVDDIRAGLDPRRELHVSRAHPAMAHHGAHVRSAQLSLAATSVSPARGRPPSRCNLRSRQ
jgi:hypothetical protein